MKKLFFAALISALFVLNVPAIADHLPDELIVRGRSESKLCGVNVYKSRTKNVVALYGKPTEIKQTLPSEDPSLPQGSSEHDYIWKLEEGLEFQVSTGSYIDKNSKRVIESETYVVDVWGSMSRGDVGSTGQGIRLGCSLACITTKYGTKYFMQAGTNKHPRTIMLEWKDGTQLTVDFDKNDRINHMQLMGEVE